MCQFAWFYALLRWNLGFVHARLPPSSLPACLPLPFLPRFPSPFCAEELLNQPLLNWRQYLNKFCRLAQACSAGQSALNSVSASASLLQGLSHQACLALFPNWNENGKGKGKKLRVKTEEPIPTLEGCIPSRGTSLPPCSSVCIAF